MDRENAHDPRAIANKILEIRREIAPDQPLTLMQLIKLVYIADGWSLALHNKPLSRHSPQAWQYGPVYPVVYTALKHFGSQPITGPACIKGTDLAYEEEFSADEEELLRAVVKGYGKLSAFQLSRLTHQPNTPWSHALDRGIYSEINGEEMQTHFRDLRKKRLVATE